jgi:hypothetical protein
MANQNFNKVFLEKNGVTNISKILAGCNFVNQKNILDHTILLTDNCYYCKFYKIYILYV